MRGGRTGWLALALGIALLVGATGAYAVPAPPPPTISIQTIGKGEVSGTGLDCGNGFLGCFATYTSAGGLVTFTAVPASGWQFVKWTDDASACLTATCTLTTASGNQTATAVFETTSATTSVPTENFAVSLAGQGTVTNDSGDYPISCTQGATPPPTGSCTLTAFQGSTLTMTEQPGTGYVFSGWGGACSGRTVSCSVYLRSDTSVSANFATATTNTLTVVVDGGGSVTGGGITCNAGSTCDTEEPPNTTITLSASPQSGYAFTGWSGSCSGTQSTCTVTMDADRSVTANFDPLVPVVITVNGNGTVSGAGITCGPGPVTCTGAAAPNTSQLLTATPPPGGSVTWTGCTSTSGTVCRVSVGTTPVSVTAGFGGGTGPPPSVSLSVDVSGDGYVTSTSGTTAIYCTAAGGTGCTATVQQGTTITLKATSASGAVADFSGWGDDCVTFTSTTCTLTMNGAKVASADFAGSDTTYVLTAQVQGDGGGTISGAGLQCSSTGGAACSSPQAAGATVTVTAQPSFGSTFTGWGGACSGTTTVCNVAMSSAKTVTATFKRSTPGKQPLMITVIGKGDVKGSAGTCASKTGKATSCTQEYADGAKVTLTETPALGWKFAGWKGACTGTKTTCTVTMSAALATTATFTPLPLFLTQKPTVTKVSGGYRITVFYTARVSGTLRLRVVLGSSTLTRTKHAAKGAGKMLVTVKRKGTYHLTLSLTAKGKTTRARVDVKV